MTIDRDVFARRFAEATRSALDFARRFIEEALPNAMVFNVQLNSSYDAHARPEARLFPDDSTAAKAFATKGLSAEQVVSLLWRDGYVPEWIDVMVAGVTGTTTLVDLTCCGRFNAREEQLYYTQTDVPPFGVKGPFLPPGWVEGEKFSIHQRTSCWSLAELAVATEHASKVWSLELHGPAFDDDALVHHLDFPNLELLEIDDTALTGKSLAALAKLPALRRLQIGFAEMPSVSFASLPTIATLRSLVLRNVPRLVTGAAHIPKAFPRVRELELASPHPVESDGPLVAQTVQELRLTLPRIPAGLALPPILRSLSLATWEAVESDVVAFLRSCPAALESLTLRRTPVGDAVFDVLDRFEALGHLDVVDTRVTQAMVDRFAKRRPDTKVSPRPPK